MKIYRIIQVAENDQIEDRGLVSLIASMNTLEGWTLEQLQYTGTDSERKELHRYVLIFFMEVSRSESAKYISEELLNQPMSDFNSWEEFYESIEETYNSRIEANITEATIPSKKLGASK